MELNVRSSSVSNDFDFNNILTSQVSRVESSIEKRKANQ